VTVGELALDGTDGQQTLWAPTSAQTSFWGSDGGPGELQELSANTAKAAASATAVVAISSRRD
jgi:hypothetical protein